MSELQVTLIPCRSVRVRAGLMTISGVSSLIMTDGTLPYIAPRVAVYVRLSGKRVKGLLRFTFTSPKGVQIDEQYQEVPPFDVAGVAETWFDARWLELKVAGLYSLKLELDGKVVQTAQVMVTE